MKPYAPHKTQPICHLISKIAMCILQIDVLFETWKSWVRGFKTFRYHVIKYSESALQALP